MILTMLHFRSVDSQDIAVQHTGSIDLLRIYTHSKMTTPVLLILPALRNPIGVDKLITDQTYPSFEYILLYLAPL